MDFTGVMFVEEAFDFGNDDDTGYCEPPDSGRNSESKYDKKDIGHRPDLSMHIVKDKYTQIFGVVQQREGDSCRSAMKNSYLCRSGFVFRSPVREGAIQANQIHRIWNKQN